MMTINPVQGIEGATVVFRGFPSYAHEKPVVETASVEGLAFYRSPRGILLKDQPTPPEGVGAKLDVVA